MPLPSFLAQEKGLLELSFADLRLAVVVAGHVLDDPGSSFARSAEILGIKKNSLSNRLDRVDRHVGAFIFVKPSDGRRSFRLTAQGRLFLESGTLLLLLLRDIYRLRGGAAHADSNLDLRFDVLVDMIR